MTVLPLRKSWKESNISRRRLCDDDSTPWPTNDMAADRKEKQVGASCRSSILAGAAFHLKRSSDPFRISSHCSYQKVNKALPELPLVIRLKNEHLCIILYQALSGWEYVLYFPLGWVRASLDKQMTANQRTAGIASKEEKEFTRLFPPSCQL